MSDIDEDPRVTQARENQRKWIAAHPEISKRLGFTEDTKQKPKKPTFTPTGQR
jgi:hypothetical protein